jgi:hypothetical protein
MCCGAQVQNHQGVAAWPGLYVRTVCGFATGPDDCAQALFGVRAFSVRGLLKVAQGLFNGFGIGLQVQSLGVVGGV